MNRLLIGATATTTALAAAPLHAVIHEYSALLQTQQEVPPVNNAPNAGGMAAVFYDDSTFNLSWDIRWWGLTGAATLAHFHGPAAAGGTASPQINITDLISPSPGFTTITSTQAAQLEAGQWYVNVHTTTNPAGEIRGQLGQAGSSQTSPFMPGQGDAQRGWRFNGVPGSGAWFDPIAADGFLFEVDPDAEFVALQMPNVVPDANNQFIVNEIGGSFPVAPGGVYTFTQPVSTFTITDINPTVDGENPFAFPIFLQFNEQSVSFTMTPIPEPTTVALLGLTGVALLRRRS